MSKVVRFLSFTPCRNRTRTEIIVTFMKISTFLSFIISIQCLILFGANSSFANESMSAPPPIIEGSQYTCPGTTVTYSIGNYNSQLDYTWSLNGGGTILSQQDNEATVKWNTSSGGPFELSVESESESGTESGFLYVTLEGDEVLVCNDNLNISLPENCGVLITADIMLEGETLPDESYTIEVRDANGTLIGNYVDANYIDEVLEVTVIHNCSGNKCWGNVKIEDKIAPVINCEDIVLSCEDYQTYVHTATLSSDNCGNSTLTSTHEEIQAKCDPDYHKIIEYTWTAVDASGNEAIPCKSKVYVLRESIDDIEAPVNYDGLEGSEDPLSCSGSFPVNENGYPDPSYTGQPGGAYYCASVDFTYTDIFIPICEESCSYSYNSYKIIRDWTVVDWCTGQIRNYTQIIKVLDTTPPSVEPISDLTLSVNPFDCSAQLALPVPVSSDNCTDEEHLKVHYNSPIGQVINGVLHIDSPAKTMNGQDILMQAVVADCCGNEQIVEFNLAIVDKTPPVIVADAHDVITLLPNGLTTLYATSLDDGSYDNCGGVGFFVKRMDNGATCQSTDLYPPAGDDNIQYNEVVHFCCDDVANSPIMVQFQVCDDADMDGTYGTVGDNCNNSMIEVTVQDKLLPVLQCPQNTTITCNEFYEIDPQDLDQWNTLFGEPYAAGTCDISVSQTISGQDQLNCGEGLILRTFTATTAGGTNTCTQFISVQPKEDAFLTCDRISFEGLNNSIYNWCAVNDNDNDNDDDLPAILIDGCEGFDIAELDINTAGLCSTVGYQVDVDTFTYTGQVCKKYVIHYEVIDQCVFDENFVDPSTGQIDPFHSLNGYFEFYLEYNVMDNDEPELPCTDRTIEANTCNGYTEPIKLVATDACTPDEILVYEWKLDVNNDGSIDFPAFGNKWHPSQEVSASIINVDALPVGEHRIYWRVSDGCGNVGNCSEVITISSFKKAPTPICYNGISIAVMEMSGSVEIWASDFDKGSFDDCGDDIKITMIPEKTAQESSNPLADSKSAWTFSCDDITNGVYELIDIRIYVEDETGAFDYCTTTLRLEDNEAGACDDNTISSSISGNIKDNQGENMNDVNVKIVSDQPEYPMIETTNEDGTYNFNPNMFFNYSIGASIEDSYLNGITTLDIVMIQKHILGLEQFNNPYTKIAADVTNDCKISGSDIVQLRKLILGLYNNDELPEVESWRFLTNENNYYDDIQPCNLKENYSIHKLENQMLNQNFVGVKMGDVNNSAKSNATSNNIEPRSNDELIFLIQDREVEEGELVTIDFTSLNYNEVYGYQFSLDFNPDYLEFKNMFSRNLDLGVEHLNTNDASNGHIALSFADVVNTDLKVEDKIFSIVFKAKRNGTLKDVFDISSSTINAECYRGDNLEVASVDLRIRENEKASDARRFELYQNRPNPFKNSTTIGFELAEDGEATIRIYDVAGKVLYRKDGQFNKGYNEIIVKKKDLNSNGVMYIHLESNGEKAVKKMLLID